MEQNRITQNSIKKRKRQASDSEKTFIKHVSDKGLVSVMYIQLNNKKTDPVKNGQKIWTTHQRRYTDGKSVREKIPGHKSLGN